MPANTHGLRARLNRPARNARRGLGIALFAIASMVHPPVAHLDGM